MQYQKVELNNSRTEKGTSALKMSSLALLNTLYKMGDGSCANDVHRSLVNEYGGSIAEWSHIGFSLRSKGYTQQENFSMVSSVYGGAYYIGENLQAIMDENDISWIESILKDYKLSLD